MSYNNVSATYDKESKNNKVEFNKGKNNSCYSLEHAGEDKVAKSIWVQNRYTKYFIIT